MSRLLRCLLVSALVSACASATPQEPSAPPAGGPFQRLGVLTYNTLHGLDVGRVWVTTVESKEARAERFRLQVRQLASVQADVILLQEVNPLPEMARAYVDALRGFDLEYQEVHQVDACGVRLEPGLALIPSLNNGLAVLVKAPLRLRKLEGLKLSGSGWCRDHVGVQTGELRYALIAEVVNPATNRKLLAVSLHLHSGIERDAYFLELIEEAKAQGRVEHAEVARRLEAVLNSDQDRRIRELQTLARRLRALQMKDDYIGAILGGDFNFEPGSPEYRELERLGFLDIHAAARHDGHLESYDPTNPIAAQEEAAIPSALNQALEGASEAERQRALARYREGIAQKRRIDFLFRMSMTSSRRPGVSPRSCSGGPTPCLVARAQIITGCWRPTRSMPAARERSRASAGLDMLP